MEKDPVCGMEVNAGTAAQRVSIKLPEDTLTEQATASFRDGVLEITMPAPPASKGRRLEIQEAKTK